MRVHVCLSISGSTGAFVNDAAVCVLMLLKFKFLSAEGISVKEGIRKYEPPSSPSTKMFLA